MTIQEYVLLARSKKTAVPAFNIPYLPMVEPVVNAVTDEQIVAIIHVARVEWEKFSSGSLEAVAKEYRKYEKPEYTFLGLDHVPVIDEDMQRVDYLPIIKRALDAGDKSVMLDASRHDLRGNIAATNQVAALVHQNGIALEAELGAVMGHESGPMLSYEEIFTGKKGFTKIEDAILFAKDSQCDWLSVAVGNIHGAVAEATRHQKKPAARLDVDHIAALYDATNIPLVLHGGSGIQKEYIQKGIQAGIAKINVGTEIRQAYEKAIEEKRGIDKAQEKVYYRMREVITDMLGSKESRPLLVR
jgi:ketose-bisphosphate aldolase